MSEHIEISPEEVQEIIDWAAAASTLVVLMKHSPEHVNVDTAFDRLEGFLQAVDIMFENIPDFLVDIAHEQAHECIEEAETAEAAVASFRRELDGL